jgi:ABC-type Fe3+-hydroxamate transport system substrate-binding protein
MGNCEPGDVVIHGAARGVDEQAMIAAQTLPGVKHLPFAADWHKHGRAAGPIRNKRMLDEGKPDLVVAFPGGRGTANMVKQAQAAGIPVQRYDERGARL